MRCFVSDCPLHGKCDLELKDADACATWRISRPEIKEKLWKADYQRQIAARKMDKKRPLRSVAPCAL